MKQLRSALDVSGTGEDLTHHPLAEFTLEHADEVEHPWCRQSELSRTRDRAGEEARNVEDHLRSVVRLDRQRCDVQGQEPLLVRESAELERDQLEALVEIGWRQPVDQSCDESLRQMSAFMTRLVADQSVCDHDLRPIGRVQLLRRRSRKYAHPVIGRKLPRKLGHDRVSGAPKPTRGACDLERSDGALLLGQGNQYLHRLVEDLSDHLVGDSPVICRQRRDRPRLAGDGKSDEAGPSHGFQPSRVSQAFEKQPNVVAVQRQRSKLTEPFDCERQCGKLSESACDVARWREQASEPSNGVDIQRADFRCGSICMKDGLRGVSDSLILSSRVILPLQRPDTGPLPEPIQQLPRHERLTMTIPCEPVEFRAQLSACSGLVSAWLFAHELVSLPRTQRRPKPALGARSITNHRIERLTDVVSRALCKTELVVLGRESNQLGGCAQALQDASTRTIPELGDDSLRDDSIDDRDRLHIRILGSGHRVPS
ncbi:MAG: hypothetical protein AAGG08_15510 [Actinomycetota bacterium]